MSIHKVGDLLHDGVGFGWIIEQLYNGKSIVVGYRVEWNDGDVMNHTHTKVNEFKECLEKLENAYKFSV